MNRSGFFDFTQRLASVIYLCGRILSFDYYLSYHEKIVTSLIEPFQVVCDDEVCACVHTRTQTYTSTHTHTLW